MKKSFSGAALAARAAAAARLEARATGRATLGEGGALVGRYHPRAVLTDAEVALVLELRAEGVSLRRIAHALGVSAGCVQHIASGRNRGQQAVRVASVRRKPRPQNRDP